MFKNGMCISVVVLIVVLLTACGRPVVVEPPPAKEIRPPAFFMAGAAEIDITPPPGLPLFGYSVMGEGNAKGYWSRLKSRVIVFEYKRGNTGKRFALVQLEWGAVSGLVYWKVAEKIAPLGFEPGDFMISATHTHAAPGGFFGAWFYNAFASGKVCLIYYQTALVEWLTTRVAKCIEAAVDDLEQAVIGSDTVMIPNISRNRSKEAWILNFTDDPLSIPYDRVIPRFHVIRLDHVKKGGRTVPRAAFIVAPLHGTSVGYENQYYHGDLFGAASRYIASSVHSNNDYCLEKPFVAAIVPGPQGDVSPNYCKQSRNEAVRIGKRIAEKIIPVFDGLSDSLKPVPIDIAYIERQLNYASTNGGKLAQDPVIGAPIVGGTEDGRWDQYGLLGAYEGNTRFPSGDHGVKVPLGADERFQELTITGGLPNIAALQLVRLGDVVTLAALPGEPTTETGRRIDMELEKIKSHENTAVVALANEYLSYIATEREYQAQHFEGAFTLFGEREARYFLEQLVQMAERMSRGDEPEKLSHKKRIFKPGSKRNVFNPTGKGVQPYKWVAFFVRNGKNIVTIEDERIIDKKDLQALDSSYYPVSFYWQGLEPGRMCEKQLPKIWIESDNKPLINKYGVLESDNWLNFIVRRKDRSNIWYATWTPPNDMNPNADYCIKVEKPGQKKSLCSDHFHLTRKCVVHVRGREEKGN